MYLRVFYTNTTNWRPAALLSSDHMDVEMENRLLYMIKQCSRANGHRDRH